MTSASELFYNRRSRVSRITADLGVDSSPDRNSHHNFNRRHHHNHNNHRHDLDGCDPLRRSPHVRNLCSRGSLSDRASIRFDQGPSQPVPSSSVNAETLSSTSRPRFARTDRLPGAVLLARERLVERLSGVSLTGNRRSSRVSSGIHRRDFVFDEDLMYLDARDWETGIRGAWSAERFPPITNSTSQSEHWQFLQEHKKKKPPGLTQDALDCLQLEVYSSAEKGAEGLASRGSRDCSICLENFVEREELILLPCGHRFHSTCLDPWVRSCGDCPYCRRGIVGFCK